MSILLDYFSSVSEEMLRQHDNIRRDFAPHKPSAGQNRERRLADFLRGHLPNSFGVDTGLIVSHDGEFSNEADLVIYDRAWNAQLYPELNKKIWLVECIHSLIEVKTQLNRRDIQDGIEKCRRFKMLPRKFGDSPVPRITDSIFTLWAFEAPDPLTVKKNLYSTLMNVPDNQSPDFIIVPGKFIVTGGGYRILSELGRPGSPFAQTVTPEQRIKIGEKRITFYHIQDSLFVWLFFMISWLRHAGNRTPDLMSYLPKDRIWGREM